MFKLESKLCQITKSLFSLFVFSEKGILKLTKEIYFAQLILIFLIVDIGWPIIVTVYFKKNILHITLHSVLEGIILAPLSLLLITIIFYGINFLFKKVVSFKSVLQITISLKIIEHGFFIPLLFVILITFPTNEISIWTGIIIIAQIFWELFVLMYFGETIIMNSKSKSILISIITMLLYIIITTIPTLVK